MLIHEEEEKSEFGTIKIHNNVITSVAYLATQEIEGISRICDDWKSSLFLLLGKKTRCGAIDVRYEKNDNMSIIIPLIVKYGYNIPEMALRVQEKVKTAIEAGTDLSPKDITIKIKGVEK